MLSIYQHISKGFWIGWMCFIVQNIIGIVFLIFPCVSQCIGHVLGMSTNACKSESHSCMLCSSLCVIVFYVITDTSQPSLMNCVVTWGWMWGLSVNLWGLIKPGYVWLGYSKVCSVTHWEGMSLFGLIFTSYSLVRLATVLVMVVPLWCT